MNEQETAVIRPFAQGDRDLVEDFFARMGAESRAFFNSDGKNTRFALKFFENDPQDRATVHRILAEADGKMVGYAFVWELDTGVPWFGIAIADDYRGHGLGTRMTREIIDHCAGLGKGGILLTTHVANIRAQILYQKCGFERMGIHYGPVDAGELLYLYRFDTPQKEIL